MVGVEFTNSAIGGGSGNTIRMDGGVIAGGSFNSLGFYDTLDPPRFSTISGGSFNTIKGTYNTVGGGNRNSVLQFDYSVISGGISNSIYTETASEGNGDVAAFGGQYAFIGGGEGNIIEGLGHAVLVGGGENRIQADYSSIMGGRLLSTCSYFVSMWMVVAILSQLPPFLSCFLSWYRV